ncbi:hypothetical protein BGZ80_009588 [Entomortierella chlamydospora]|uniref:OTU domain-containing protein n=1 Tax=Entomortierella chlamydospora TaxID=101097 RepID=A0A9P6MX42_9FUNG|nr:hypothetical protein BGZ79_006188 [Entomortierella chlamydospora]KAG0015840.1 hypothetical protein BGZ80_009588 [Entomortierella chlamydospora]
MGPVKTRSTAPKHRQDRGYKADPEDTNDDDDFYGMRELKHQLAGLNLQLKDTMGDGNCLFRACADQFFGSESNHNSLRAEVCQYIEQHADHFSSFLDNETVEAHVSKMRKNGTYGGNIELVAFARMKRVDIKVYQPGYIYVIEGVDVKKEGSSPGERPTMHIAYHSWEHYSSIRNIDGPHEGLPEISPRPIKQKPLAKLTSKDPPRSIERMIMNVTGVQDLELVRELLEKHHGNTDNVYNELYEQVNGDGKEDEHSNALDTNNNLEDTTPKDDVADNSTSLQDAVHNEANGPSDRNDSGKDEVLRLHVREDHVEKDDSSPSPNNPAGADSVASDTSHIIPSSSGEPTKGLVPKKRISAREKKELAKRNQKLNRKNKGKTDLSSAQSNTKSNGKSINDQSLGDSFTGNSAAQHSNMRELFV